MGMTVASYNVNVIRAAMSKGFVSWLVATNPDVICLQEIKAMEDQIDTEALAEAASPVKVHRCDPGWTCGCPNSI